MKEENFSSFSKNKEMEEEEKFKHLEDELELRVGPSVVHKENQMFK